MRLRPKSVNICVTLHEPMRSDSSKLRITSRSVLSANPCCWIKWALFMGLQPMWTTEQLVNRAAGPVLCWFRAHISYYHYLFTCYLWNMNELKELLFTDHQLFLQVTQKHIEDNVILWKCVKLKPYSYNAIIKLLVIRNRWLQETDKTWLHGGKTWQP